MRTLSLIPILVAGCATFGATSGHPGFPGKDKYAERIKALEGLEKQALTGCGVHEWSGKGGFFEVTADAAGKVSAKQITWESNAEVAKCIVDNATKLTLPPLAGPPVAALWGVAPPNVEMPKPSEQPGELPALQGRLTDQGVTSCAQRFLPPEMPVDVEISLVVFGTKPWVVNVSDSTVKDGEFEGCVMQYVGGEAFPAAPPGGLYLSRIHFHVGRSNKSESI